MDIDENILIGYIDNSLSDEEQRQVEAWAASSLENQKQLEQLYFTLEAAKRLRVMKSVNADLAFEKFKSKIQPEKKTIRLNRSLTSFQRYAAIFLIPVLLIGGFLLFKGSNDMLVASADLEVTNFDLPDGSRVWLNAGSTLTYPGKFGKKNRTVELKGEGYFEVAHTEKPFIVTVGQQYRLEVLGTTFNIRAYQANDAIETTLINGTVRLNLLTENGSTEKELVPGEKTIYHMTNKSVETQRINPKAVTAWTKKEHSFKMTPMKEVIEVLSKQFKVRFDVKNKTIYDALITATFDFEEDTLTEVMDYIKISSGINYVVKESVNDKNEKVTVVELTKNNE